jgi:hypothetical protein
MGFFPLVVVVAVGFYHQSMGRGPSSPFRTGTVVVVHEDGGRINNIVGKEAGQAEGEALNSEIPLTLPIE